jgi:hypothetical protein
LHPSVDHHSSSSPKESKLRILHHINTTIELE